MQLMGPVKHKKRLPRLRPLQFTKNTPAYSDFCSNPQNGQRASHSPAPSLSYTLAAENILPTLDAISSKAIPILLCAVFGVHHLKKSPASSLFPRGLQKSPTRTLDPLPLRIFLILRAGPPQRPDIEDRSIIDICRSVPERVRRFTHYPGLPSYRSARLTTFEKNRQAKKRP